jgi:hypothetical protein
MKHSEYPIVNKFAGLDLLGRCLKMRDMVTPKPLPSNEVKKIPGSNGQVTTSLSKRAKRRRRGQRKH